MLLQVIILYQFLINLIKLSYGEEAVNYKKEEQWFLLKYRNKLLALELFIFYYVIKKKSTKVAQQAIFLFQPANMMNDSNGKSLLFQV